MRENISLRVRFGGVCLIFVSLFVFCLGLGLVEATPRYYDEETCSKIFPPTNSSQVFLEQRYYFEGCDFGNTSVLYCPRPLVEKRYNCIQTCVYCHSDPWVCLEWNTIGCNGTESFEIISEPCGIDYNGGDWIFGDWVALDTSDWLCPNARKLAELYEPQESGLSFNDLSVGGKNSNELLRSGEETVLSFAAYVSACLNRIPVLLLTVNLADPEEKIVSQEYGIYAKHRTLDYLNENSGIIEGFEIPDQIPFRVSYSLDSSLDGYVSWAWRRQFVEAVEKIVNLSGNNPSEWKSLPDDVPESAQKTGDLYFSEDFVGGIHLSGDESEACTERVSVSRVCNLNLLSASGLGLAVCDSSDLETYYSKNGLTSTLEGIIRSNCGISETVTIDGLSINPTNTEVELSDVVLSANFSSQDIFGMDRTSFAVYATNPANAQSIYNALKSNGLVSDAKLASAAQMYLISKFGVGSCLSEASDYSVKNISVESVQPSGETLTELNMSIDLEMDEDFMVQLAIETSFDYNCTQSWTWGSMANLEPKYLAECLYNWENCLELPQDGGFYEAASAGYGPMEATPTLENDTARILLDGKFTRETQQRNVTVYRSCGVDDAWVAPQTDADIAFLYACPIEAYLAVGGFSQERQYYGRQEVGDCYRFDESEGQQHLVLKCDRAPSLDERCFVAKVELGSLAYIGDEENGEKLYYICTEEGWVPWRRGSDPDINKTDPADPNENKTDPNDPNKRTSDWGDEMFTVEPVMVTTGLGDYNANIWHVNILSDESRDVEVYLYVYSKDYDTAINWLEFNGDKTESCGDNCMRTQLTLPATGKWDPYGVVYTSLYMERAERAGSYEFEFIVKEVESDEELYRKSVWLNIVTDAIGYPNVLTLALFLGFMTLVIYGLERKEYC